jgi:hypothetical protein
VADVIEIESLPAWKGPRARHAQQMTPTSFDVAEQAPDVHKHQHAEKAAWAVTSGLVVCVDGSEELLGPATPPAHGDWRSREVRRAQNTSGPHLSGFVGAVASSGPPGRARFDEARAAARIGTRRRSPAPDAVPVRYRKWPCRRSAARSADCVVPGPWAPGLSWSHPRRHALPDRPRLRRRRRQHRRPPLRSSSRRGRPRLRRGTQPPCRPMAGSTGARHPAARSPPTRLDPLRAPTRTRPKHAEPAQRHADYPTGALRAMSGTRAEQKTSPTATNRTCACIALPKDPCSAFDSARCCCRHRARRDRERSRQLVRPAHGQAPDAYERPCRHTAISIQTPAGQEPATGMPTPPIGCSRAGRRPQRHSWSGPI